MGSKLTTTIKERRAREQAREQRILSVLTNSNKRLDDLKEAKRQKKKSLGELIRLTNFAGIGGNAIRPIEAYIPRSYNLQKQVYGLIDHLYVRYRVPGFLYHACLDRAYETKPVSAAAPVLDVRKDPFMERNGWMYRQWFVTIAQGGSFHKQVKDIMTSREATVFLSAPIDNLIHENVWWARMTVAGLPPAVKSHLLRSILGQCHFVDTTTRLRDVIAFFARYHVDMNRSTLGEITDFIAWKLRFDPEFSLKGRTIGSVVRLCNEWHVHMQKAKLGSLVMWPGFGKSTWQFVTEKTVWQGIELHSNRDLLAEGKKQRHCVYSYVQQCVAGRSFIFSIRGSTKAFSHYDENGAVVWNPLDEQSRVTVEVNARGVIVQIRGPLNRAPGPEEMKIVRRWAGELGFTFN
jgi:hypothetical protein